MLMLMITGCEEKTTTPAEDPNTDTPQVDSDPSDPGPVTEDPVDSEDPEDPIVDITAPTVTLVGDSQMIIEYGELFQDPGALFTDNVDEDGDAVASGSVDIFTLGSYVITYLKTDSSGNVSDPVSRTVFVVDTTDPVITINGESEVSLEIGSPYYELGAIYMDQVDGSGNAVINGLVDDTTIGTYQVTYSFIDSSNNTASTIRTVHIVDTTDPVITLKGLDDITLEYGTAYLELGASYTDNYDPAGNAVITGSVNENVLGDYILTYSYTDSSNNTAFTLRTVHIVDTTDPVITVLNAIDYTYRDEAPVITDYLSGTDNYDGDITSSLAYTFDVEDYYSPGSYTIVVTATDSSGNMATTNLPLNFSLGIPAVLSQEEEYVERGLELLFDVMPQAILISDIGYEYVVIDQINPSTGLGTMADGDYIDYGLANKVTAPEYIEIVGTYNNTLKMMNDYLESAFFGLYHIEALATEYFNGTTSMFMVKIDDDHYEIVIVKEINEESIRIKVLVEILPFVGNYHYSISFNSSEGTYHYEVLRGSSYVTSLTEVAQLDGNLVKTAYYEYDGDDMQGVTIKDENTHISRRYFDFTDEKKGIYCLDEESASEGYLSLDANEELVFEYKNLNPNNPTTHDETGRWAFGKLLNVFGVLFNEGTPTNEYTVTYAIDQTTYVSQSAFFTLEAKNYNTYVYDDIEKIYERYDSGSWTLVMKGDFDSEFDSFFEMEDFITIDTDYDVKAHIQSLQTDKNTLTLFGKDLLTISTEEVLVGIE